MNPLNPPPAGPSGLQRSALVASLAERRWLIFVLLVILSLLSLMVFTALHWAAMPPSRVEKIDVRSVHLRGEFIESNLGSALEASGRVVVRLVAQQYSFVPQCLVVPEKTPVTFRGTSTDAIHGFLIGKTNANTMLIPGFISTFTTSFEPNKPHLFIRNKRMEHPYRIATPANASQYIVGQTPFDLQQLRSSLSADNSLEIAYHFGVWLRTNDTTNQIMSGLNVSNPIPYGFIDSVLKRLSARLHRYNISFK